jgi:hypothetical protein
MKNIIFALFCNLLLAGCMTPADYIAHKNYDAAVRTVAKKLDGKHQKTKHLKVLEISLAAANQSDFAAIEKYAGLPDLASLEQTYLHYNNIYQRQKIVEPLLPLASKDGYRPVIRIEPVEEKVVASYSAMITENRRSAREKIERAEAGNKKAAREAFRQLDHFQKKHNWQEQTLKDSAFALGQIKCLVKFETSYLNLDANVVVRCLEQTTLYSLTPWILLSQSERTIPRPDYMVAVEVTDADVSTEYTQTTCTTITEKVQTGEKIVTDSTGKEISREPIYEDVTRTEVATTYWKDADAKANLVVTDKVTGEVVLRQELKSDYDCYNSSTNCPSDDYMLERCAEGLASDMRRVLKKLTDD